MNKHIFCHLKLEIELDIPVLYEWKTEMSN